MVLCKICIFDTYDGSYKIGRKPTNNRFLINEGQHSAKPMQVGGQTFFPKGGGGGGLLWARSQQHVGLVSGWCDGGNGWEVGGIKGGTKRRNLGFVKKQKSKDRCF